MHIEKQYYNIIFQNNNNIPLSVKLQFWPITAFFIINYFTIIFLSDMALFASHRLVLMGFTGLHKQLRG